MKKSTVVLFVSLTLAPLLGLLGLWFLISEVPKVKQVPVFEEKPKVPKFVPEVF